MSSKPRVGLFVTCLVDLMRPSVGFAAVKLLEQSGYAVFVPEAQTCCGQPAWNGGADKDALEAWLKAHPGEGRRLIRENRSFVFFRETPDLRPDDGPIGAAGVAQTPGRSLAVDRRLVTFHAPVWVAVEGLAEAGAAGFRFPRLMIAQDTGSAIVGPGRGDLFFGSGSEAGSAAGKIRNRAAMTLLFPRRG